MKYEKGRPLVDLFFYFCAKIIIDRKSYIKVIY